VALSRLAKVTGGLLLFVAQVSMQAQHQGSGEGTRTAAAPALAMAGDAERGRYIVEQVVMCAECHSPRDAHGQIIANQRFMGGPMPVRPPWPNNWALRAPRIAGLPGYTDELVVRLLPEGAIGRHGEQLRLPMPRFHMTASDAQAVAAYLRSLP